MKKKIIRIVSMVAVACTIGIVLANNKAKIDKAANPVKEQAVIPVKAYEVEEDSFNISFSINGTTSPAKEVQIASEVQGKLVNLNIENGDMVSAGQVLATLDASVYHAQMNSIDVSLAKAEIDIARFKRLMEMGGASATQLESAVLQHQSLVAQRKDLQQQMSHMQIRAPFSGKIENVKVEKGSYVTFGTVLGQLIDNSSLKIRVFLSEQEAFKVQPGQEVTIKSVVLSEPKSGRVTMISDKADAAGKFLAEISFNNTDKEKLKAGMLADVFFPMQSSEQGLSIPIAALLGSVNEAKVFVIDGGHVTLKSIKTGIVTSDKVQVIEGLTKGERIVLSGQLNLENGSPITINN